MEQNENLEQSAAMPEDCAPAEQEVNQPEVRQMPAPAEAETRQSVKKDSIVKPILKRVGRIAVALAFGALIFFSAARLEAQEKRTEQLLSQLQQQILALQEELDSKSFTGNGNSISGTDNEGQNGGMTPGQVYAKTVNSVVAITNEILLTTGDQVATAVSSGTGFILTEDGFIVTNYHVVEGATKLTVTLHNGEEYQARLQGYDATHDLAVLKIEATGLQAATLGSSKDLIVGDQVAVIGNPLGDLTATLTVGYVSATDRIVSTDGSQINMIQTDASVNSGNSGGPIFNMKGEVVGIITAKYSGLTSSGATIEGIGFAIPIDDVARKISDLKEYGYITGAYLGILAQNMDQDVAEFYGLPLGVYVKDTSAGYCAEAAGIQAKDIIIGLGGQVVSNMNDLSRILQEYKGGETTTVTVWRSGLQLELQITLDEKPKP